MKERPIATVTLLRGETVTVDADQVERLRPYRWYFASGYAYAQIDGRPMAMHAFLMSTPKGMHTDHINRDKLDNRLENLRVVEPRVNVLNRRTYEGQENPFFGKTHSDEFRARNSQRWSKPVAQYTPDGDFLAVYPSTVVAAKATDISEGNISSACTGRRKTAGGFKWQYVSDRS